MLHAMAKIIPSSVECAWIAGKMARKKEGLI
jgi:hypothetical protein